LFLLSWNLFITNVPGEVWTPETVIKAYPIRWQIEIFQPHYDSSWVVSLIVA
jgi:hypothetical protein